MPFALRICGLLQLLLKVEIWVKKKPNMPLNDISSVFSSAMIWFHYLQLVCFIFFLFFLHILLNVIKIYEHFELPTDLLDEPSWPESWQVLIRSSLERWPWFCQICQIDCDSCLDLKRCPACHLHHLHSWTVGHSVMTCGSSCYCPPTPMQWHAVIPGQASWNWVSC